MGQISPKFLVPPIGETTSRINAKFGGDLRTAGDGKVGYYVCHAWTWTWTPFQMCLLIGIYFWRLLVDFDAVFRQF